MFTNKNKRNADFLQFITDNKNAISEILNDSHHLDSLYQYFIRRYNDDMVKYIKQYEDETVKMLMNSDTPWFKILDKNAVNLKDKIIYNKAFINQLKELGYRNNSDEYIITQFLDNLHKDDTESRKKLERDAIQNSDVPWVEVLGNGSTEIDDRGFVQLKLDWNPAFIRYLNENGIKEKTDELSVQKWISSLNHQTIMNDDGNGFV